MVSRNQSFVRYLESIFEISIIFYFYTRGIELSGTFLKSVIYFLFVKPAK